ncbi:MAG: SPOR domain-containing protein [Spirochaetaceae bacterium]|jgi:hypothetical protein|nr:SPOR domain-containing protein [Spirochaetaceae bacterium]
MKKIHMILGVMAVSVFFLNASIWEGIARIIPGDGSSEKGYGIATNAFPPNTVVEVTNLENGKAIRAVITSALESPGFLATFSRDTAAAMDARSQSLVRVKITEARDPGSFSPLTGGTKSPGEPSQGTGTANKGEEKQDSTAPSVVPQSILTQPGTPDTLAGVPKSAEPLTHGEVRSEGIPDIIVPPPRPEEEAGRELSFNEESPQSPEPLFPVPPRYPADPDPLQGYDLVLIPVEERPPVETADAWILPPEAEIAPLGPLPLGESFSGTVIDPALIIPSLEDQAAPVPLVQETPPPELFEERPFFSVPVITSLEPGQYYLQLGAFGMIELVEAELSRIGKNYPLVIQGGGNPQTPLYRILLGPVNLGESGALMQRFKSLGYEDAFIRQGSN